MKIDVTINLYNLLYPREVRINALMLLGTSVSVAFSRFD